MQAQLCKSFVSLLCSIFLNSSAFRWYFYANNNKTNNTDNDNNNSNNNITSLKFQAFLLVSKKKKKVETGRTSSFVFCFVF